MRDILYNDATKVKDLTVGELKDIIMECLLSTRNYQVPLDCVSKIRITTNTDNSQITL